MPQLIRVEARDFEVGRVPGVNQCYVGLLAKRGGDGLAICSIRGNFAGIRPVIVIDIGCIAKLLDRHVLVVVKDSVAISLAQEDRRQTRRCIRLGGAVGAGDDDGCFGHKLARRPVAHIDAVD